MTTPSPVQHFSRAISGVALRANTCSGGDGAPRHIARFVALLLALTACGEPDAAPGAATARGASLKSEVVFDGFIVPQNAIELRAPQNTFRVGSWNSDSSWIKLIHFVPDGKEVKAGDVIAKFEFPGDRAKEYVDEQIRSAEAFRDQSGISQEAEVDNLVAEEQKKLIDAERAELDTLKRGVISERDWELARITHQQALFDAEATGKHRDAVKRALRAEADYHERNVERALSLQKRFDTYAKLFEVRAQTDGVVRHGYHRRRGRKVEKGDGMPAGMHFASLAADKTVWVQFFVPERHWSELAGAKHFAVETQSGTFGVTLEKLEEFPQELGFLKNDEKLPNAREKAYVVWARFDEQPEKLSAGVEVRVRKR